MLPYIANQKYAVGCVNAMKKLVHVLRACKARFIDNKQPFLSIRGCAFRSASLEYVGMC
jgi:hypothetical protein